MATALLTQDKVSEAPKTGGGMLDAMAKELEAGAVPGMKVERIPGKEAPAAEVPGMKASPTVETPLALGAINFKTQEQTALTPEQREALVNALKGINPAEVVSARMIIYGGRQNGEATVPRTQAIAQAVGEILGKEVPFTLVPAPAGSNLQILTPDLYITREAGLEGEKDAAAKVSGGGLGGFFRNLGHGISEIVHDTSVTPMITTANDGSIGGRFVKKGTEPKVDFKPEAVEVVVGPLRGVGYGQVIVDASVPFEVAELGKPGAVEVGPYVRIPIGPDDAPSAYGEGHIPSVEGGLQATVSARLKGADRELKVFGGYRLGVNSEGVTGPGCVFGVSVPLGKKK